LGKVVADFDGSLLVPFSFRGTLAFDPSTGLPPIETNSVSQPALAKLNADGSVAWVKTLATGQGSAPAVALDAEGSIYLAGRFFDTLDVDPSAGEFVLRATEAFATYIVKLDAAGRLLWSQALPSCVQGELLDLEVGADGTLWALGDQFGACDPALGDPFPSNVSRWVLRLDAATGSHLSSFGAEYGATDLVIDAGGAVYLAVSPGQGPPLIHRLDESGSVLWTQSFAALSSLQIAPAPDGGVVAAGYYELHVTRGFSIRHLDRAGSTAWRVQIPSEDAYTLGIDANAHGLVAIGYYRDERTDFDPGPALRSPVSLPGNFITRYSFPE